MKTPVVSALAGLSMALGLLAGAAAAADPCEVPSYLWFGNNDLKHVAEAVKQDKRLTIAVVGTGSSILAGPDGPPSVARTMSPFSIACSTLPPRTGMRIRSSSTSQSTSNHAANGESRPSRSSDHSGALRCVGCGTVMWFGTTSTT